jgi:hypothetical protein
MGEIDVATFLTMSSGPKERVGKGTYEETFEVPVGPCGQTKNGQTTEPITTRKVTWKASYADAVMMRSE